MASTSPGWRRADRIFGIARRMGFVLWNPWDLFPWHVERTSDSISLSSGRHASTPSSSSPAALAGSPAPVDPAGSVAPSPDPSACRELIDIVNAISPSATEAFAPNPVTQRDVLRAHAANLQVIVAPGPPLSLRQDAQQFLRACPYIDEGVRTGSREVYLRGHYIYLPAANDAVRSCPNTR